MHYLLTYQYTDDYLVRRNLFRNEHLRHAWAAQARGELLLGGAAGDPPSSAVLVFSCDSAHTVEQFVQADPYVVHGLVHSHTVQPWATVVGKEASTPVHPQ
jgi:uncharacterized protein YciI